MRNIVSEDTNIILT